MRNFPSARQLTNWLPPPLLAAAAALWFDVLRHHFTLSVYGPICSASRSGIAPHCWQCGVALALMAAAALVHALRTSAIADSTRLRFG
jgi:hypothetical protein